MKANGNKAVLFLKMVFAAVGTLSILFNIITVAGALSRRGGFIRFEAGKGMNTAACVMSVPAGAAVEFGVPRVTLKEGESAYLQYSAIADNVQGNWDITYLYDPEILEVRQTSFGVKVTALTVGECLMQTLSLDGIRDAALVQVEPSDDDWTVLE